MKKTLFGLASVGLPGLALAQSVDTSYWEGLLDSFSGLLDTFVVVLISLAVVYFIWNVFGYIRSANDEDKKAHAAGMVWGIIGLAVIVSVWGLVTLLQTTFGVSSDSAQSIDNLLPR
ncbi:MAG: hypothetical protein WAV11_01770 [Minisyncoccia bacterium]